MEYTGIFAFIVVSIIVVAIIICAMLPPQQDDDDEEQSFRAGKRGEKTATEIIKRVMKEGDVLLTNVCIEFEGKRTELDNVIVNKSGVFIIEVKNYSGMLIGAEDDYEWTKYKISEGGNTYEKQVRNPIKQVKRQVYILSHYLKYYGIHVWVEGYVFLLNNHSPIPSDSVLESYRDIERVIHRQSRNLLNKRTMIVIKDLLD